MMLRRLLLLFIVALSFSRPVEAEPCAGIFDQVDRVVGEAGKSDAEAHRLASFAFVRSNRFLASYRHQLRTPGATAVWLHSLGELDRQARTIELANLYPAERNRLPTDIDAQLDRCRELALGEVAADPAQLEKLRRESAVPDAYASAARVLGLYPITAPGVAIGYRRWLANALPAFDLDPLRPAPIGELRLWSPPQAADAQPVDWRDLPRDALGRVVLDEPAFRSLTAKHAPIFAIETVDRFALPGRPRPGLVSAPPTVVTADPVVYVRADFQRSDRGPLLQLTYTIWFAGRPVTSPFDALGGALDGVMWRVTLAPDGQPWVYDTAHACGCYHFAFPTPEASPLGEPADRDLRESLVIPATAPSLAPEERIVVRLAAGSHYVEGISALADTHADHPYRLDGTLAGPDFGLRSTEGPLGRQSLYGADGLVAGSERGERWFLWPMGVVEPGAMRQWGHHATAFVGRRHFDDPRLLSDRFALP